MRDHRKDIINIVALHQDMTNEWHAERQRQEIALHQDRIALLEDLIGDVSHDLRSPLTVIKTSLELLRIKGSDAEIREKYIARIEAQSTRLLRLIEGLLTMSRLQRVMRLTLRPIDLGEMVASASGLGLAIVQRIVEIHSGEIQVESAVDQGPTFRLLFPRHLAADIS